MRAKAVTVGMPVRDLDAAVAWYRAAFDLGEPDVVPTEGVVEFDLRAFWLQLFHAPALAGAEGVSVNISVQDATADHAAYVAKGLVVTDVQRFGGAVDVFELTDLDGNTIGFVTELG